MRCECRHPDECGRHGAVNAGKNGARTASAFRDFCPSPGLVEGSPLQLIWQALKNTLL
jgi:hypothetical protein